MLDTLVPELLLAAYTVVATLVAMVAAIAVVVTRSIRSTRAEEEVDHPAAVVIPTRLPLTSSCNSCNFC